MCNIDVTLVLSLRVTTDGIIIVITPMRLFLSVHHSHVTHGERQILLMLKKKNHGSIDYDSKIF